MKPLEEWLSEQRECTIQTLASYIQQYIDEQWQKVLQESWEELMRLYDQVGEPAYGRYAQRLFRPLQEQLKQAGFASSPSFPGALPFSRERGPLQERVRWMWSVVRPVQGAPIGTIVIQLAHDHTRFRLPHPPGVIAIEETNTNAILQAVSQAAKHLQDRGK